MLSKLGFVWPRTSSSSLPLQDDKRLCALCCETHSDRKQDKKQHYPPHLARLLRRRFALR